MSLTAPIMSVRPRTRALLPNDLFALKYVHDARFSPDGQHVAYVTSHTVEDTGVEFFQITLQDLNTGACRTVDFPGRATLPRWAPDGRYLAFIGTNDGSGRLYLADVRDGTVSPLSSAGAQVQGAYSWSPDSTKIAYTVVTQRRCAGIRRITRREFRWEGQGIVDDLRVAIYFADVKVGTNRVLEVGSPVALQPAFSPCGRRILFFGSNEPVAYSVSILNGVSLFVMELEEGTIHELLGGKVWAISGAAWSPCGERIVFAGAHDSPLPVPNIGLWTIARNGSTPQNRTQGLTGNVGLRVHHDMPTWSTQNNIFFVPNTEEAYATVQTRGCAEIWRIALDGPVTCKPVLSGPRSTLIMDVNTRAEKLLYCVTDLINPWDLYCSTIQGSSERRLTNFNDSTLASWPAMSVKHLKFESPDGIPLEGWYLSRADRSGRQPTVMFIHGGPYHGTGHAFRFDFRLLATNGFAVLLANFRGSVGYGEPFARAIMGDWGSRAFPDHMAAVDAAVSRGWADEKRLGVWGHSHGGFATAWIVGHTDRFQAAVVEAGPTNFTTMYYLSDAPHLFTRDFGARPDEAPDLYRSRSPLTYAARCRTPTLMLHGEEDYRCPMAEAEQFYRALHDVGCVTELVQIPGMNHMGDSTGPLAARRAQNEALLDWFERFL